MTKIILFVLLLGFGNSSVYAQHGSYDSAGTVKPFKIFDNLYYVGNDVVSAYLLVTDQGIVLIDALYGKYTGNIAGACKELGLDALNIKYILCTHAHFDHAEGAAAMQQLTHARVGMTEPDWDITEGKIKAPYTSVLAGPLRDWVIRDGDSLRLGNTTLHFFETPGHTPGVLSIAFPVRDGNHTYKAFMFGGIGLNFDGLERTKMYLQGVNRILKMKDIQVNISNHPDPGKIIEKANLLAQRKPGQPNPFVAPEEFQVWIKGLKKAAEQKLVAEKKKLDNKKKRPLKKAASFYKTYML